MKHLALTLEFNGLRPPVCTSGKAQGVSLIHNHTKGEHFDD